MKGHARIAPVGATEHQRDLAGTNNVPLRSERVASLDRPLESSPPPTGDIGPALDPDGALVVGGYEIVSGIGASASANATVTRELGGEPRDIDAFVHPDAVPHEFDGEPHDIDAFVHPDAVLREFDGEPRDIGAFADPDVAVSPDPSGEPRDAGDFLEPDG